MLPTTILAAFLATTPVVAPLSPPIVHPALHTVLRGSAGAVVGAAVGLPTGYAVAITAANAQVVPRREGGWPRQDFFVTIMLASVVVGAYAGWCVAVPAEVAP